MNTAEKYTRYALVREMLETPDIIRNFRTDGIDEALKQLNRKGKLFFTGEGSSRIFPAKNAMRWNLSRGAGIYIATEGARQASEYNLGDFVVFGASNSGRTKEVIALFQGLKSAGHDALFSLTANRDTTLESLCRKTFILSCGGEDAVAATKSVVEQALFYQSLLAHSAGISLDYSMAADAFKSALTSPLPEEMINALCGAGTIYFAGRNDGAAEELTLKTNEITRKKSDYLEGTYAVHGIEEVMNPDDVVIIIDPFESEISKIEETLVDGVGLKVFALTGRKTADKISGSKIKTAAIDVPEELSAYSYLALGWNILVETGISLGIDLDRPVRARKVGNEVAG